jgi:hypothetical protein
MYEARTVKVTVTEKDGTLLDVCEMTWDQNRCPADSIEVIPCLAARGVLATHPAQNTLTIGK